MSRVFLRFLTLFLGLVLLGFSACKPEKSTPEPAIQEEQAPEKVQLTIPAFSADSAYAHVERQVNYGPRIPNSKGHEQTRAFIRNTLERYGAKVTVQEFPATFFDGNRATGYNIIGSFNPGARRRIFLAAHYDTRPFADSDLSTSRREEPILGADDGGSGVGVLLELARQLHENPIPIEDFGVDFVFYDLEDYGKPDGSTQEDMYTWGLGSQHWAKNPFVAGYAPKWGILLDMVGAKDAVFGREQFSQRFAPGLLDKVWKLAQSMGRQDRFVDANIGYATDDHYFVNVLAGWPMIDVIYRPLDGSNSFGKHWHTHDDDMDIISRETLGDVGQVMTAVIYREAGHMF